ncbi:hypothetical protein G5B38_07240 [Pseudohalocynthiibacter aestuariivivens]|uniref:UrcA family protein n=1 Tax=Roseovarius pelagicus TaxID=2980108 RepID=A0ABY6D9F4_9RHOB|nr:MULTISPECIES: hypothetical protein [Rhodobacterales]QIE45334.1 hypothetical protein G5B38_07240 [Pseudohalocynthiibacter aestuariivivens]UXX82756.1 hypothetical protein N7U68_16965 [Roseovarius pelagicus]
MRQLYFSALAIIVLSLPIGAHACSEAMDRAYQEENEGIEAYNSAYEIYDAGRDIFQTDKVRACGLIKKAAARMRRARMGFRRASRAYSDAASDCRFYQRYSDEKQVNKIIREVNDDWDAAETAADSMKQVHADHCQ